MGWLVVALVIFGLGVIFGGLIGFGMDEFIGMIGGVFVGGFIGFLLALFPVCMAQVHYNERTLSCQVRDKDRGGNEDGMRVYTSCGTFQNTDSWLRGKTNSGDMWARIHPGTTQQFTVVGWRLGLTSDFPNILEVR